MAALTPRQQQVLSLISEILDRTGRPPSLRELADHLGITGTLGVSKHLDALERKGYLSRSAGGARSIRLLQDQAATGTAPILGQVAAGPLSEAIEHREGDLPVPPDLARAGAFWLRVRGESMIDAAIRPGDLVLIHPSRSAADGDIVVVRHEGEATLKRWYLRTGHIELRPENSLMEPIRIPLPADDLTLIGTVQGLFRFRPGA